MVRLKQYFAEKGNITGFLPRWVFLAFGVGMIAFEWMNRPVWTTLVLVPVGIVAFFVVDHFAPRALPWLSERKQQAEEKLEKETKI